MFGIDSEDTASWYWLIFLVSMIAGWIATRLRVRFTRQVEAAAEAREIANPVEQDPPSNHQRAKID